MNEYLIDEFLSSEVQNIEVTEEEMQEIYDFYKAQAEAGTEEGQEAEFPAFDEIRNELEQMVRSDKEQEYILNLIEELKADITIQIYI
jgi:peptidyl-prolyl cis-trans isomerase SurA